MKSIKKFFSDMDTAGRTVFFMVAVCVVATLAGWYEMLQKWLQNR